LRNVRCSVALASRVRPRHHAERAPGGLVEKLRTPDRALGEQCLDHLADDGGRDVPGGRIVRGQHAARGAADAGGRVADPHRHRLLAMRDDAVLKPSHARKGEYRKGRNHDGGQSE
jgi:hypothetical protein